MAERSLDAKLFGNLLKIIVPASVALLVALIACLRGIEFDNDFENYDLFFRELRSINLACYEYPNYEPLFSCAFYVLSPVGTVAALFFLTWLALFAKFYVVMNLDVRAFFLFVPIYGVSFYLIHELNQTRLAAALIPIYFIYRDNIVGNRFDLRHLIFLILGFLLHYSSALLAILIFLSPTGVTFYVAVIFFMATIYYLFDSGLLLNLISLVGDERIHGYFKELTSDSGGGLNFFNFGTALYLYMFFLTGLFYLLNKKSIKYKKIYLNFTYFSFVAFIFYFALKEVPVVATRLAELMRSFSPLMLAFLLSDAYRAGRKMFVLVSSCVCLFVFGSILLYGPSVKPINSMLIWAGLVRDI